MPPRAKQVARRVRAQPTAMDIEISNQRAAELTEANAEIARLQAENARLRAHAEQALNHDFEANACALMAALLMTEGGEDDEITRLRERIGEVIGARGLAILSEAAWYADMEARQAMAQATQSTEPFTGQGNRLGE